VMGVLTTTTASINKISNLEEVVDTSDFP